MARAYTVGTVALALAAPASWVDNILSHHRVSGVLQKRQGVSRKVTLEGLLQLAIALNLIRELEMPAAAAIHLSTTLARNGGRYDSHAGITVSVNLEELRADLETRLAQAVEIAAVPRRGRPPRPGTSSPNKTGRLD